jgi:hypothetical protein
MRCQEFIAEYDEYKRHTKIIHQAMRRAGYRRVGSGADSVVYAKDAGTVIKLIVPQENDMAPADRVFMAWYQFCQKNAGNPYLPRFVEIQGQHHATFDIDGETFRQTAMEKLRNLPTATFNRIMTLEKSIRYNQSLKDTVMRDVTYLYRNRTVPPEVLKYKQRDLALAEKLMAKYPGFYETLQSVIATGQSLGFRDDVLADGNIMMRADGTPVITDPWVL